MSQPCGGLHSHYRDSFTFNFHLDMYLFQNGASSSMKEGLFFLCWCCLSHFSFSISTSVLLWWAMGWTAHLWLPCHSMIYPFFFEVYWQLQDSVIQLQSILRYQNALFLQLFHMNVNCSEMFHRSGVCACARTRARTCVHAHPRSTGQILKYKIL
jgi:hypothetical protein